MLFSVLAYADESCLPEPRQPFPIYAVLDGFLEDGVGRSLGPASRIHTLDSQCGGSLTVWVPEGSNSEAVPIHLAKKSWAVPMNGVYAQRPRYGVV